MGNSVNYQIDIRGDILKLKTSSFKVEEGSVLHSDIFNRELAAMLSAGVVVTVAGIVAVLNFKITTLHFVMAFILFGASFFVLRTYIFNEPVLNAVFDKGRGIVDITVKKVFGEIKETYNISDVAEIRLGHVAMKPENPDGIKVVMNVSLQHGTVIPGFGKTEDFYTAQLQLREKSILIFSSKKRAEAQKIIADVRGFMGDALKEVDNERFI